MNDEYGGLSLTEDYALSHAIGLHFFSGQHELSFESPECAHLPALITEFAGGGWRRLGHRRARFDEGFYLGLYPDVVQAIAGGRFASGEDHFRVAGRAEHRRFRLIPDAIPLPAEKNPEARAG